MYHLLDRPSPVALDEWVVPLVLFGENKLYLVINENLIE